MLPRAEPGTYFPPAQRNVRYDVGDGRHLTIDEIAAVTGVNRSQISKRVMYGVTGAGLLEPRKDRSAAKSAGVTTVVEQGQRVRRRGPNFQTYDVGDGRWLTQREIAAELGCSQATISKRIIWGISGPDLLAPVAKPRAMKELIEKSLRRRAAAAAEQRPAL